MTREAAYQLDGRRVARAAFYAATCDPRRHVCVEACAGAGKTWMLVARIVRALLDGAAPQEILAITFTRKAAGEMRTRLSSWLREAASMSPQQAADQLREFGLDARQAEQRALEFIGLHERVLESGRDVELRTIHAWYAQLLAAAPMELLAGLGLSGDLELLEDRRDLIPTLMQRFHEALLDDAALRSDHRRLILRHGRHSLYQWFKAALDRRGEIELADESGVLEGSVPPADDPDALSRMHEGAFASRVRVLSDVLGGHSTGTATSTARMLRAALGESTDGAVLSALRTALFTNKGSRKGEGPARAHLGESRELHAMLAELDQLSAQIAQQDAHEDHLAMTRLTRSLFAHYRQLTRERGLVDMIDLERLALVLLSEHEMSGWVQQRLDSRVRHLLIDEFQDTSPLQWHALQAWLAAYAGAGGGAEAPRVFIVGDPKQSIYRFRGADPRVFEAAQQFVVDALDGTLAACDHTRRCAPGVVGVVNHVFGQWQREGGGHAGVVHWRDHTTERSDDGAAAPLVKLPTAERPPGAGTRARQTQWRPSLTQPKVDAKPRLRDLEADEVARAIAQLTRGEGIEPGSIMVLGRKKAALEPVVEALARHQVPHVAPNDLVLAQLPEVQDLLAVLDVLASPTQALSLARALKSPICGVGDDDLLDLARRASAQGGWWPALLGCADDLFAGAALRRAAQRFEAWAKAAPTLPPHDLLDRIVHEADLLRHLVATVPPGQRTRAVDAVRALLGVALDLDGGRYASPYAFVRALRARTLEEPASVPAGAVQLLTIHRAKGLEARVVFLVDTQPEAPVSDRMTTLVDWPVEAARPANVAFVASHARCPQSLQPLLDEELAAREREEANALYVALTRAEERIFISCTPASKARGSSWWNRLETLAEPQVLQAALHEAAAPAPAASVPYLPKPRQATPPRDAAGEAAVDAAAALLGQAVHRVLEWSARAPQPDIASLAQAAARAFGLADAAAVQVIAQRIWDSPACRRFFDAGALLWAGSEVAVATADGRPRRLDRLVLLRAPEPQWWVLDYKLSSDPQHDPALRAQLADYRAAVAALVPGQPVRAAFITGAGALIELAP